MKPPALGTNGGFFDYGVVGTAPSFGIFKPAINELHFETRTDENTQRNQYKTGAFEANNWTNIVIVWTTNNASSLTGLYVNGNQASFWTYSGFNFNPTENYFTIGQTGYYGVANAYLDELKIYDYVKSAGEIKQDYNDIIGYIPPNITSKKPQSKGPVKINSSGLFINNQPFFMRGVGYQPTPICQTYGYDFFSHPEIYARDFALLRDMNANTIRTWAKVTTSSFLDAAYNNGNKPIYVVMGFYIPSSNDVPGIDYGDPATIESYKTQFRNYVNQFKNHPSVLLWAIGNENNLFYTGDMVDWYSLANELAKVAYEEEGEFYHPTAVINGDIGYIGDASSKADDSSLNYTDIWGINAYRGYSFVPFLNEYKPLSSKPLWVSEFGIDALDNTIKQEYEETQADWDLNMWNDIANSDITIGGTVMEYSDEWQKDWATNNPCEHTKNCAYVTPNHPDGCSNEEWYGIMRTVDNGVNPDIMQPRKAYYAFQSAFGESQKFNISLKQSWNLVSIPLSPENKTVSNVLKSIAGKYSSIFYFANGRWIKLENNDKINETIGFYIKMNNPSVLEVEGTISTATINLQNGWNLIGYPYLGEKDIVGILGNNITYSYNGTWSSYIPGRAFNSLQKLKPGYGYWIKKI